MNANPISDAEHADRVAALRAALDRARLDAVILYGAHRDYQPADLRYFARWYCIEEETAALFVARDGPAVLLTDAGWDVDRAKAEAYADDMRLTTDMGADLAELVREHSPAGSAPRVGIAGYGYFPAPVYLTLAERLPGATLTDAGEVTAALRMVKSAAELELMRAASEISDRAMAAGLAEVRDGAAEIDVAAAAEEVIRRAGARFCPDGGR
jgi:Xaa-Pro aminopeptidase